MICKKHEPRKVDNLSHYWEWRLMLEAKRARACGQAQIMLLQREPGTVIRLRRSELDSAGCSLGPRQCAIAARLVSPETPLSRRYSRSVARATHYSGRPASAGMRRSPAQPQAQLLRAIPQSMLSVAR